MAYVTVPKDLTKIKSKVMFNLTQTCWIGIMDPHNNVRYVEGKGAFGHSFAVSETGKYRVFVQNRGTKNVSATGGYYFE